MSDENIKLKFIANLKTTYEQFAIDSNYVLKLRNRGALPFLDLNLAVKKDSNTDEPATKRPRLLDNLPEGHELITHRDVLTLELPQGASRRYCIIKGPAGSGKTTLLRELAAEWAKEEVGKSLFDIVIYLELRQVAVTGDLHSEISRLLVSEEDKSDIQDEDICKMLNTNQCLFLLDGLNEVILSNGNSPTTTVSDIILGRGLKETSICLTTLSEMHPEIEKKCIAIQILGFSEANATQFIRNYFSGIEPYEEAHTRIFEKFRKETFQESTILPLNLLLACFIWECQGEEHFPKSLADVYPCALDQIRRARQPDNHASYGSGNNNDVDNVSGYDTEDGNGSGYDTNVGYIILGKLCWALQDKADQYLKRSDVSQSLKERQVVVLHELLGAGLMNYDTRPAEQEHDVYSFVHKSIHERLAAFYLLKEILRDADWLEENVIIFHDVIDKKNVIYSLLNSQYQSRYRAAKSIMNYTLEDYILENSTSNLKDIYPMVHPDEPTSDDPSSQISWETETWIEVTQSMNWEKTYRFLHTCLELLGHSLQYNSVFFLHLLERDSNKIEVQLLFTTDCFQQPRAKFCNMDEDDWTLYDDLPVCYKNAKEVCINGNDEEAPAVLNIAVWSKYELILKKFHFEKSVIVWPTAMSELKLTECYLSPYLFAELSLQTMDFDTLEYLCLSDSLNRSITEVGETPDVLLQLNAFLASLKGLSTLSIIENTSGSKINTIILQSLRPPSLLAELYLRQVSLTKENAANLSSMFSELPHLRNLWLGLTAGEEGVLSCLVLPSSLVELNFYENSITSKESQELSAILIRLDKLKQLNVSRNPIGDQGLELLQLPDSLEVFDIRSCSMRKGSLVRLNTILAGLTRLKILKFDWNLLSDQWNSLVFPESLVAISTGGQTCKYKERYPNLIIDQD